MTNWFTRHNDIANWRADMEDALKGRDAAQARVLRVQHPAQIQQNLFGT
ncbi:hypothetical protein BPNSA17_38980 [Bordetella petrii]